MIKIYKYPQSAEWKELLQRPSSDNSRIRSTVEQMLQAIKRDGDQAVRKFSQQFDGVSLDSFELKKEEWAKAADGLNVELRQAIDIAISNITAFHAAQKDNGIEVETTGG